MYSKEPRQLVEIRNKCKQTYIKAAHQGAMHVNQPETPPPPTAPCMQIHVCNTHDTVHDTANAKGGMLNSDGLKPGIMLLLLPFRFTIQLLATRHAVNLYNNNMRLATHATSYAQVALHVHPGFHFYTSSSNNNSRSRRRLLPWIAFLPISHAIG